jgi:DNA polymerase bacteriophage-type
MMMPPVVYPSIDFETYSEAGFAIGDKVRGVGPQGKGGLPVVGTPVYAEHPSCEVLCLRYDLLDGKGVRGWMPGTPDPVDLLDHVRQGRHLSGWNVTFEFWIWNMVCVRKYGWPPLTLEQLHCTMARSRRFSMPGSLGNAAMVLGTALKDTDGKRLIQKLTRPHTPSKNRPEHRWTLAAAWPDHQALYHYCGDDVRAEMDIAGRIPDLTYAEYNAWQLDQRINARGVQVDTEALRCCLHILGQAERKYTLELATITGGAVGSVSEVAKIVDYLRAAGVHTDDLQKETVEALLKRQTISPVARRVLEIRQLLGAANVKKLRTLNLQVSSDGRLRDQYTYCGADRTGRASAGGVQLQNITAKGPKTAQCESCECIFAQKGAELDCPNCSAGLHLCHQRAEWDRDAVAAAIADIKVGSLELVEKIWGDPVEVLCGVLRGLFISAPGKRLVVVDFSAIEAVVLACLSRCQWRIDVFSTHGKIYEQSAANATGIPMEEILDYKRRHGAHHPSRKTIGKVRELAGGYGGWVGAWKQFGAGDFMTDDEIKADVLKWREESPEIVDFWGSQYRWCGPGKWDYKAELHGLEGAAIQAIQNPGQCFAVHDITYGVADDILYCRLPSGRFLHYHRPRLEDGIDKLKRGGSWTITFEGYNSNAAKGPVGWYRMETYGGRLAENVTQAVAADIQFDALARCDAAGYPIVMHTHDEGVAEVDLGVGSVEHMTAIMAERPSWASWWPIRAAGWDDTRYGKD